jgi:hypothetical protein
MQRSTLNTQHSTLNIEVKKRKTPKTRLFAGFYFDVER